MQMADITIKKADGVTNVVYSQLTASAGDRSPAVWRNNTSAALRGNRATFTMESHPNGPGTARRVTCKHSYPITRIVDAREEIVATIPTEFTSVLPQGLSDSEISEAIEQAVNMFAATLIRQSIALGYAPV